MRDPSGNIPVETLLDVGSFVVSAYQLANDPTWANLGWLIADGVAVIVPYAPGSYVVKATAKADNVTDTVKILGKTDNVVANASRGVRYTTGTVVGYGKYSVSKMMRGSDGNLGIIPNEIAQKLNGKTFETFDDFRSAFWKEVANSKYANEFSKHNINRMSKGLAPKVVQSQTYGELTSYILHHMTPIHAGGNVYDLDNLVIVTPKMHQEILDKTYHLTK